MALHFLVDDASKAVPGGTVVLTGAEAHHAATVRRVRVGEPVTVGDGRGVWAEGECAAVAPREVSVRILTRRAEPQPTPRILLVQALAKGDRDELAVQAATELGVAGIVPWQAARSVSRWDAAKAEKGRTRWAGIVREASKQAHRAWVPEVEPVVTTAQLVRRAADAVVLVLEPSAPKPLSSQLAAVAAAEELLLVVGPEGGIAPDELAALADAGADLVRLGPEVLRTSTAGPVALAAIAALLGRW